MKRNKKNKIGILGGTFDPPHIGHLAISKEAKKRFYLKKILWTITKKNPFKKESSLSLKERIIKSKKLTKKYKYIQVSFFEDKIRSNRTINLINFFNKKSKNSNIYLIIGADNLINFHKWDNWQKIIQKCNILVFDRTGYKAKSLKSIAFKKYKNKGLKFVNFKKKNISSSKLRKI